ncbi:MAG: SDR family NAD(P)-dependent oxidoreductase [Rhodobacteraceae bacterium]|nr:SDR family NAD(P)-dependent oxidoreductase [Paracoccaceae bacterium]MBR9819600.1 SDR family NAD(P)-dependent oxidoreductase [Paracoccaceae bacterium]
MSRIRARPTRIAIAGGSRGIGAALAQALAGPGVHLFLAARELPALERTAGALRAAGATVGLHPADLCAPGAAADWLAAASTPAPPELMIIAMGLFGGRPAPGAPVPEALSRRLIEVNLTATIALAEAAAERMRPAGQGTILLLSSLAARDPLPDARAYSASKAGLSSYAHALRADLAGTGVSVLLVEPGHVATRQAAQHRGALPMLLQPEQAARRILRAHDRGASHLAFPRRATLALGLLNLLPWRLRAALLRDQRFCVDNPPLGPGEAPRRRCRD